MSFEGSEGSGKTTQVGRLAAQLNASGREVLVTREPGGSAVGEHIRHLLKHAPAGEGMCPETELLLFAASRAQLVRHVIEPALNAGKYVICDRFLDSTTVYQGAARRLPLDAIVAINHFAVGNNVPDLTIILDVSEEVRRTRMIARGETADRIERESGDFFERVRKGYIALAEGNPNRIILVDGNRDVETVEKEIWDAVQRRI